jgi:hypothetical protein
LARTDGCLTIPVDRPREVVPHQRNTYDLGGGVGQAEEAVMALRDARDRTPAPAGRTVRTWVLVGLLLFGVWLSIAPYVLEYRASGVPLSATVNDTVVGVAVVALALVGLGRQDR